MVIRILYITALFFMAAFADNCGCTGSDDNYVPPCYKIIEGNKNAMDLVTVSPIQNIFEKGDTITYKISVPSTNTYFGEEIDLFEKTNDHNPILNVSTGYVMFEDNESIYIKGSLNSLHYSEFNMEYDSTNNIYELEVQVVLLRTGLYPIPTHHSITFSRGDCEDNYIIFTNTKGWEADNPGKVEFYVKRF